MASSLLVTPASVCRCTHVDPETFHATITEVKGCGVAEEIDRKTYKTVASRAFGAYVHAYSAREYSSMKLFVLEEADATASGAGTMSTTAKVGGIAIKGNGEVVSVFKNPSIKARVSALDYLIPRALAEGGKYLDCFDGILPNLYAKYGFEPVARLKFNADYAPEDWNFERDGSPDIIFMRHDGSSVTEVEARLEEYRSKATDKVYLAERERRIREVIAKIPYVGSYEEAAMLQGITS